MLFNSLSLCGKSLKLIILVVFLSQVTKNCKSALSKKMDIISIHAVIHSRGFNGLSPKRFNEDSGAKPEKEAPSYRMLKSGLLNSNVEDDRLRIIQWTLPQYLPGMYECSCPRWTLKAVLDRMHKLYPSAVKTIYCLCVVMTELDPKRFCNRGWDLGLPPPTQRWMNKQHSVPLKVSRF